MTSSEQSLFVSQFRVIIIESRYQIKDCKIPMAVLIIKKLWSSNYSMVQEFMMILNHMKDY